MTSGVLGITHVCPSLAGGQGFGTGYMMCDSFKCYLQARGSAKGLGWAVFSHGRRRIVCHSIFQWWPLLGRHFLEKVALRHPPHPSVSIISSPTGARRLILGDWSCEALTKPSPGSAAFKIIWKGEIIRPVAHRFPPQMKKLTRGGSGLPRLHC